MSPTELLILGVVVAMFSTFVVVLGGTNLYLVLSDRKEEERLRRQKAGRGA
jgi:hypothetical protein